MGEPISDDADLVESYVKFADDNDSSRPDFHDAYAYLLKNRARELIGLGYDNKHLLAEALKADEFAIEQSALIASRSKSEIIYNLAKQRGFVSPILPDAKEL
jgi:hypothetical protein